MGMSGAEELLNMLADAKDDLMRKETNALATLLNSGSAFFISFSQLEFVPPFNQSQIIT